MPCCKQEHVVDQFEEMEIVGILASGDVAIAQASYFSYLPVLNSWKS